MKKLIILLLCMGALAGCMPEGLKTMYVEPRNLSKETGKVLETLYWNGNFYDFKTDEPVAQVIFQCWNLTKEGRWEQISAVEGLACGRSEGSFAVSFGDDLKDGYHIVITSRDFKDTYKEEKNFPVLTRDLSLIPYSEREYYWTEGEDIIYNESIPLLYQFDKIYCYEKFNGNLWEEPEDFLKMDHFAHTREDWKAYCLTVTFETNE